MYHSQNFVGVLRSYFSKGTLETYRKGSRVLLSNADQKVVYFIRSGYVRIYSTTARKEEYTHIIYGQNELFPLTWLSKQDKTSATYQALTDVEVYAVPLSKVSNDLENKADLTLAMLRQAVEQYRIYSMRVDNLEYKYASERLAYRLIMLANRFGEYSGKTVTIVPPMTHQLLASSLNLSRESVSREIEKLARRDLVRYNAQHQIILPSVEELAKQLHLPMHQGLTSEHTNVAPYSDTVRL